MTLEQLGPIVGPILLILTMLASSILVGFKVMEKIAERKNGGSTKDIEDAAGHGDMCGKHDRSIERLVTSQEFTEKEFTEIKVHLNNIWEKVNGD